MSDVLDRIIKHKRLEVDERIKSRPLAIITENLKQSDRSLYSNIYEKSVNKNQPAYILECKKASPSKGLINKTFDLNNIINIYDKYASGISVLTDNHFFQGRFEYLTQAKALTGLPILCKDFFIDSYQVYEARYFGADAILLMLSVLDDNTYRQLAKIASELSLDILTEVHDEEELKRAIELDAKIIGINNRNLKDLSISLSTTKTLAPKIKNLDKSNTKTLIISESGISSHSDINKLSNIVDGFLVGSHLMASDNLHQSCKQLLFGKIKICGLTRIEDVENTNNSGATYAGLIFYKGSKRVIDLAAALSIINNVDLNFVGVFVNEDLDIVIHIANQINLFAVQLHGQEDESYISSLKSILPNIEIWKAVPINENTTTQSLAEQINRCGADKILLDTQTNAFGGTGERFNWKIIKQLDSVLNKNRQVNKDVVLAGGLSDSNIDQAKNYGCNILDVNSGIEISPGIKSKEKMKNLFNQIASRNTGNE
ncbi:MAG: bifunctional indole-3-glycerol-phosphate synthase TrpC/phosphoribosylanthranilate isomerase TrpF [Gammaproteobacteria bacterium]|nr:MAG: bifunctional indole-3-glycerol-phosphate synthase TrpC/phosphoribosylanthranilate isomerase TrpF [Gammaproteobacteria bacterium]